MNQGSFLTLPQNFTTLEVNHNLQDLYSYISTSFGIDPTSFYLTAKGKPLNPAHTILDYGLKPDSLIEINYRCYGGQPTGISTSKPLPRNKRRRDVKRNTTLELLNRIHRGINTGGAQTFEQQMNSLKKEIDNSINRDSEKFWDVIGIQLFDTPITRIASCNTEKDTLIVAEQSNNIHYYSIKKRKTKHKFPVPLRDDEKICALALSHSDKYVIIGTTSCSIFIYNRKKRDHYQTIDTDAADDLKIRKIKAITTVKTIKDQQSETHAYHSSLNDNDDERTSLLKAQIDQDEYMVIHDEFEGLIFINMADWRPNADLNGYGKFKNVTDISVDFDHTHLKCVMPDESIYSIYFVRRDNNSIDVFDHEVKDDQHELNIPILALVINNTQTENKELNRKIATLAHKIVNSESRTLLIARKGDNSVIGVDIDEKKTRKYFNLSMMKSEYIEVVAGTGIFASRFKKELTILKSREKIDTIFSTESNPVDPFLNAKQNQKKNLRQKKALAHVNSCARCVAISTTNHRVYSGWEDGKIIIMNYIFKKIEGEIPRPPILEKHHNDGERSIEQQNSISHDHNSDIDEKKSSEEAGEDHQEGIETMEDDVEYYSSDSDDSDDDIPENDQLKIHMPDESDSDFDNQNDNDRSAHGEDETSIYVTALIPFQNYLFAGYSNGLIMAYDQNSSKKICLYQPSEDEEPKNYCIHCMEIIVFKGSFKLVVRTSEKIAVFLTMTESPLKLYNFTKDDGEYFEIKEKKHQNIKMAINGNWAVTTTGKSTCRYFNLEESEESKNYPEIDLNGRTKGPIVGLCITPDFKRIGIASADSNFFIYDIKTNKISNYSLRSSQVDKQEITEMKMTQDGLLIFGLGSGGIRIIDLESQEEIADIDIGNDRCSNITLSADDELILVNSRDWSQKLVVINKVKKMAHFNFEDGDWVNVQTTVINDSDTIIASYSETILLINIKTKETIALKKDDQDHGRITCIEVLEKNIYLGFGKGVIKICDIPNTKKEMTFTTFKHVKDKDDEDEDQIILCLRVTYDQKYIICALDSKCIKVYDHNSKVVHHNFSNLEDEPKVLAVHPTVHDIFMVAIESDIYVYSIKNKNKQTSLYNFHAKKITALAFSKNGKLFASACEELKIKISVTENYQNYYTFDESNLLNVKEGGEKDNAKKILITCLAFAGGDRFLVYGGKNILKIQSIETKSLIYNFNIKEEINSLAVSNNSQYLICGTIEGDLIVFNMPIFIDETHTIPYSDIISPYSRVGTLSNLSNKADSEDKGHNQFIKHKNLYFWPYNWSILHFFAIKSPERLENIPSYNKMKIKWIIDQYGRTPLHYLLGSSLTEDKTNYTSVNRIFDYILDFLEDNLKNNTLTFYDTMKSLSNISTFMFAKCQPESLHRYLQMAFSTPTMLNKELPKFGIPVRKIRLEKEPILSEEGLEDIYKQGSQTVKFRMVLLYYDFNPLSEDMLSLILVLSKLVDQNFFKTRAISTLVDYLWRANLKYNYAIALCFSILMILASIDLCIETPPLALQIVILVLDFLFILHECLQISCHGLKYFKSVWNYFDLGFYIMLIIAIILQLAHSEDSLAQGWIFTFVFLIGFGRWISYLRLFDLSRNLIRTIIDILMNMWGFIIIIGAIILGFTLTLYVFDKSYFFSDYLLNTYFMLYGNNNLINPSVSQNILAVTVTFMLGVFFLNMLVSIMNDSFDDSQRLKVIKDAKERLDIIFESTNLMRLFFKNRKEEHGYLVFCERVLDYNNADEEVDPKDLTDNINYLKKTIMRSEGNILTKIKKRDQSIQSRLKEIEDKFETLNDSLKKANEENDAEERDKKVNKRMDKLENKLDSITTSIANLTRIINDKMEPPQDDKI